MEAKSGGQVVNSVILRYYAQATAVLQCSIDVLKGNIECIGGILNHSSMGPNPELGGQSKKACTKTEMW
jgi:hypothetical protein